jgi:hypothetical protein
MLEPEIRAVRMKVVDGSLLKEIEAGLSTPLKSIAVLKPAQ